MSSLPKDSTIDKAILAINKLESHNDWYLWSANIELALDYTWEYIKGDKALPPNESKPEFESWKTNDHNTCQRI